MMNLETVVAYKNGRRKTYIFSDDYDTKKVSRRNLLAKNEKIFDFG